MRGEKPDTGIVEFDEKRKVLNASMVINNYNVTCTSSTSCTVEGKDIDPIPVLTIGNVTSDNTSITIPYTVEIEKGSTTVECVYGIDEKYGQVGTINEDNNTCTLTNLTKGTTYYFKLTPISDKNKKGQNQISSKATTEIVSWSEGTEEEIAKMLKAVDEGKLTMQDTGWKVGDERTVTLGSPVNETVTFVIIDLAGNGNIGPDGKDNTTSGGTIYHALVGQKNSLNTLKAMNTSETNAGGYNSTNVMKPFIDGDYTTSHSNATIGKFYNLIIPSSHYQTNGSGSTTLQLTKDVKFILFSEYEVVGNNEHGINENQYCKQFEYYKNTSSYIRNQGDFGSAVIWRFRTAHYTPTWDGTWQNRFFVGVRANGELDQTGSSSNQGVVPFAAI